MVENINDDDQNNKNDDEYLRNYLSNNEYKGEEEEKRNTSISSSDEKQSLGNAKELSYISIDINELPCKYFYPAGTSVFVKAATVQDIQAFSTVDDTNFYDLSEKVNAIIERNVFLKYPDGVKKPYTALIDHDKWYLLFLIREMTFSQGADLYTEVDGEKIPLKRGYFMFHEMNDKLKKHYDKISGSFVFNTKKYGEIRMAPPTIGIQKSFTSYMVDLTQRKKTIDQSFVKIIPLTMPGVLSITKEGIEKKFKEFKNMDDISLFSFMNQMADMMNFGISGVKKTTENGLEVRSEEIFPGGASQLFVLHDDFEGFLI
jgi:hypothetical protein